MDVTNFLQPELVEVNRLPARQPLTSYANDEQARRGTSRFRRSLNGTWRFKLVDSPSSAPRRWHHPATNDGRWTTITVPGVWTRQGFADLPPYTNVVMPWQGKEPPYVPHHNPPGLYRPTFTVPRNWRSRDVIVHLGGQRASPLCGAMENSSEWEKILDFRPSSTSPSWSPKATTSSQSWSSDGVTPPGSKIKITGGMRACTDRFTSRLAQRCGSTS